ncbi:MAG: hypothetical protein RLZZ86_2218 [Cyanobacteriota bacterium]|jgi:transposase
MSRHEKYLCYIDAERNIEIKPTNKTIGLDFGINRHLQKRM